MAGVLGSTETRTFGEAAGGSVPASATLKARAASLACLVALVDTNMRSPGPRGEALIVLDALGKFPEGEVVAIGEGPLGKSQLTPWGPRIPINWFDTSCMSVFAGPDMNITTFSFPKGANTFLSLGAALESRTPRESCGSTSLLSRFSEANASSICSWSSVASCLTAVSSSCADLADFAASPASTCATVNEAISNLWSALFASSSSAPLIHSPRTPITTKINPIPPRNFPHPSNFLSHFGWREFSTNSPAGNILATALRSARCLFLDNFCEMYEPTAWMNSGTSSATPIHTRIVDDVTESEAWCFHTSYAALIGQSPGGTEIISAKLRCGLFRVTVGAIIFYVLLILECTIGIISSIKKLFSGHLMLDMCRYIAYIVPRLNGNESAKHDKASTDNSGLDRRELH
jgi:hypothetical protein